MTSERTLVLGGARSGKSRLAESMFADYTHVRYVATGYPPTDDPEWTARVEAHQRRRPPTWTTVETLDLVALLREPVPTLIDCIALWLTRTIDDAHGWDAASMPSAAKAAIDSLVQAWSQSPGPVVAVTNEVGLGVVPDTPAGRRFRDELGSLNQRLAEHSDTVWLVAAGIPLRLR